LLQIFKWRDLIFVFYCDHFNRFNLMSKIRLSTFLLIVKLADLFNLKGIAHIIDIFW